MRYLLAIELAMSNSLRSVRTLTALCGAVLLWSAPAREAAAQTPPRSAYEELQTFSGVLNHIRTNYPDSVSYSELVAAAIRGVLRSLDPHSYYVSRADETKRNALERGELYTVGIALEDVQRASTVLTVAP